MRKHDHGEAAGGGGATCLPRGGFEGSGGKLVRAYRKSQKSGVKEFGVSVGFGVFGEEGQNGGGGGKSLSMGSMENLGGSRSLEDEDESVDYEEEEEEEEEMELEMEEEEEEEEEGEGEDEENLEEFNESCEGLKMNGNEESFGEEALFSSNQQTVLSS